MDALFGFSIAYFKSFGEARVRTYHSVNLAKHCCKSKSLTEYRRFILEPDEFPDVDLGALPGARGKELPPPDGVAAKVLVENVLPILFQGAVDKFVHGPILAVPEWPKDNQAVHGICS